MPNRRFGIAPPADRREGYIAEGAGEFSGAEKARFHRSAKRSATECAAVLDVAKRRQSIDAGLYAQGRSLLLRIVGMLVKLVWAHS
jgi:four helix bundle protein